MSSAAAQSTPAPAQPPTTALQSGDVSCDTDINCFSAQAATCTSSGVTYTVTLDFGPLVGLASGLQSSTTDVMRVSPESAGSSRCRLALVVQQVETQLLPEATAELAANGVNQASIDALQASMAESNRGLEGRWGSCIFAPNDLVTMLSNWSNGEFSTNDFSTGTCSGTYFGG
ncbi:MAG: hypothetical protein NVSMB2_25640 [Chloroflexota bacterium]